MIIKSKKSKTKIGPNGELYLNDHGRPVTRRQLLGQGFLTGSVVATVPSLLGGLIGSKSAYAQALDCTPPAPAPGQGPSLPFICLDLGGGANIAGSNALVGGPGGQLDALSADGYANLGLPGDMIDIEGGGNVDTQLGIAFHNDSGFLRGIINRTSQATRDNVNGAVFVNRSDNDTGNNPHNPMYGINKAGARGELVQLVGTQGTDSGGRSVAPASMIDLAVRPTRITSPGQARGLVDAGRLTQILRAGGDSDSLFGVIEELASLKLTQAEEVAAVKNIMGCSYPLAQGLVSQDPASVDPTVADPAMAAIFPGGDLNDGEFLRTACISKLVLGQLLGAAQESAGAGTITMGGFDYHTGNRAVGEGRDFKAGEVMGGILEYAAAMGRPVMLYVFSDGSVIAGDKIDGSAAGRDKFVWQGDRSTTGAALVLVYNPNGRPAMRPGGNQMGWFGDNGFIDQTSAPFASSVELLVETIVLNYLALEGREGEFTSVFPNSALPSTVPSLDNLIAFQALA